jgi:integrase
MRDFEDTQDPEIKLRLPQRVYYFVGTPSRGSGSVQRTLKTKSFKAAQQNKRTLLVELRGLDPRASNALFSEVAQEVLQTQSRKAPATSENAKIHIKYLNEYFGDEKVSKIDEKSWESYVAHQMAKKANRLFEHERRHFIMIMRRAHDLGYTRRVIRIKKIKSRLQKGKVLSDDEIAKLLKNAAPALYAQIIMGVTMGLRRSEILFLTWDRVDLDRRVITLRAQDTKIRKARDVPISAQVYEILYAILDKSESGPVFPSRYDSSEVTKNNKTAWMLCKARAGVKCRFHDLRHTFLTRAFKKNVNPALICDYAGLSMQIAQRVYLHFTNDDKREIADLVSV